MKSYIRIAPDVEYFTDYDRFREAQICCAVAEDGTSLLVAIGLCWLILFPEYPKHRY